MTTNGYQQAQRNLLTQQRRKCAFQCCSHFERESMEAPSTTSSAEAPYTPMARP